LFRVGGGPPAYAACHLSASISRNQCLIWFQLGIVGDARFFRELRAIFQRRYQSRYQNNQPIAAVLSPK
jgi:hypothetical protein